MWINLNLSQCIREKVVPASHSSQPTAQRGYDKRPWQILDNTREYRKKNQSVANGAINVEWMTPTIYSEQNSDEFQVQHCRCNVLTTVKKWFCSDSLNLSHRLCIYSIKFLVNHFPSIKFILERFCSLVSKPFFHLT